MNEVTSFLISAAEKIMVWVNFLTLSEVALEFWKTLKYGLRKMSTSGNCLRFSSVRAAGIG